MTLHRPVSRRLRRVAAGLLLLPAAACARRASEAPSPRVASDTVWPGDPRVDARRLPVTRARFDWRVDQNGTTRTIGTFDDQLVAAPRDGRATLQRVLAVTTGTATLVDSSWSDPRTLAPIAHRSAQPARRLAVEWVGDAVRGGITPANGVAQPRDSVLGLRTFDSSNWDLIIRALDLAPGRVRHFPVYDVDSRVSWYRATVQRDTMIDGRRAFVVDAQLGRTWAELTVDAATRAALGQRMGNPQAPMRVVPITTP